LIFFEIRRSDRFSKFPKRVRRIIETLRTLNTNYKPKRQSMCFSATASFGAGIVLSTIGIATIKKAQRREQLAFAAIPLLFAIQQFSEGFVWVGLQTSNTLMASTGAYIFLFFAQVLWPFWVPWSVMILEKKEDRRIPQKILLGVSVLISAYLAWCLLSFNVDAQISSYHIKYQLDYPETFGKVGIALYVLVTITPPYFSHIKGMKILATIILGSYIITFIFYREYLLSVWCFFSALISVTNYFIIRAMSTSTAQNSGNEASDFVRPYHNNNSEMQR
jgi:hypothetical protein